MDAAPGHARAVTGTALSETRSEVYPGNPNRPRCDADSAGSVLSCEHFFLFRLSSRLHMIEYLREPDLSASRTMLSSSSIGSSMWNWE